jgi:hypothetical protein
METDGRDSPPIVPGNALPNFAKSGREYEADVVFRIGNSHSRSECDSDRTDGRRLQTSWSLRTVCKAVRDLWVCSAVLRGLPDGPIRMFLRRPNCSRPGDDTCSCHHPRTRDYSGTSHHPRSGSSFSDNNVPFPLHHDNAACHPDGNSTPGSGC